MVGLDRRATFEVGNRSRHFENPNNSLRGQSSEILRRFCVLQLSKPDAIDSVGGSLDSGDAFDGGFEGSDGGFDF